MQEELSSSIHQEIIDKDKLQYIGPGSKYNAQNIGSGSAIVNVYEQVAPRPVEQAVVAAAQKNLLSLPLDGLPGMGTFPSASRLVFSHNLFFVGRERELVQIAKTLKERDRATIAITGLGGAGKSQLASEFVHRYGQYFAGGVFWLSFADAHAVQAEVADCTTALGQELRLDARTLPIEEQVQLVLSSWQSPLPRLLIFDNCEDESLLARWRPRIGGCRVLITSRREVWHPDLGVSVVPLDVLPREKSVKLLGRYRFDLSVSDREQIAQELGDLPLALSLAGSYLHTYQESRLGNPQQYLFALRQVSPLEHESLQQEGNMYTTGHIEHVARTFALSYEQLDPGDRVDAAALQLLAHVAYFAPGEPIPRDLLRRTMEPEKDDEQEDSFVKALKRVHALGLLNSQQESAQQMHHLLVSFVQGHVASTASAKDAQASVEQAIRDFAWDVNEAGYPSPLLRVQEHLRVVAGRANERGDAMAADLNCALGRHLQMIGAYQEALSYLQRALVICEQELGPTQSGTVYTLNNLANLYQDLGKYEQAEPLYQRVLAISKQELGPTHPDTGAGLTNLAELYRAQGKYEQAEPLYQRALAICEQELGPTHPTTALSFNNLANLYQVQGKYEQAEPLYQRALAICEQELGPTHPTTANTLNNLALLYHVQGKYKQAEPLYQRALPIYEQVLGPTHSTTQTVLKNYVGVKNTQKYLYRYSFYFVLIIFFFFLIWLFHRSDLLGWISLALTIVLSLFLAFGIYGYFLENPSTKGEHHSLRSTGSKE
jgi:tetratricopeptide (TPR) repeat protein